MSVLTKYKDSGVNNNKISNLLSVIILMSHLSS